jgi:hypothetical protein
MHIQAPAASIELISHELDHDIENPENTQTLDDKEQNDVKFNEAAKGVKELFKDSCNDTSKCGSNPLHSHWVPDPSISSHVIGGTNPPQIMLKRPKAANEVFTNLLHIHLTMSIMMHYSTFMLSRKVMGCFIPTHVNGPVSPKVTTKAQSAIELPKLIVHVHNVGPMYIMVFISKAHDGLIEFAVVLTKQRSQ